VACKASTKKYVVSLMRILLYVIWYFFLLFIEFSLSWTFDYNYVSEETFSG
jgi:hypothetical protein